MKPTIAITMGDPAGVGPEVILKAIADKNIRKLCNTVVLGDEAVLEFVSAKCKLQSYKPFQSQSPKTKTWQT